MSIDSFYQIWILQAIQSYQPVSLNRLYRILTGNRTMSTLIGVTEDKGEVFFASLPHLNEGEYSKRLQEFFRAGMIEEKNGLVHVKQPLPKLSILPQEGNHIHYLLHPSSYIQVRDVTRLWIEWLSYHCYEYKKFRPLIQNAWLQQLFKRWYQEEKAHLNAEWFTAVIDEFNRWAQEQSESVKCHWIGLFHGAKSSAFVEADLAQFWDFQQVEDCEALSRLVFLKWVTDLYNDKQKFPICYRFVSKMIQWISYETSSVQDTVFLFQRGMKRKAIAKRRQLKESTINDHLLKYYLLTEDCCYQRVEESPHAGLYRCLFENGSYPKYKEAKDIFEKKGMTMDFFLFRYYQIKALKERD